MTESWKPTFWAQAEKNQFYIYIWVKQLLDLLAAKFHMKASTRDIDDYIRPSNVPNGTDQTTNYPQHYLKDIAVELICINLIVKFLTPFLHTSLHSTMSQSQERKMLELSGHE